MLFNSFYHHDLQFRCYAHLFFLSLRTTKPDDVPCPVEISSLCNFHNTNATARLKHPNGSNLSKNPAFAKLLASWNLYQKKYSSRMELMKKSHRIDPVFPGKEVIALSASGALIGTRADLSLGTKSSESCTSISCALLPEKDVEGPPMQFYELYNKRNVTYKNTILSKITSDQLANLQLLVRMDIQYLSSVDVDWKEQEGGGASPEASHGAKDANPADGEGGKAVGAADKLLTVLLAPKMTAAGSVARDEERLIRFALRKSKQDF